MKYAALPTPSAPVRIVKLALPIRILCGGDTPTGGFVPDPNMVDGSVNAASPVIDTSVPNAAPAAVYQSERYSRDFSYTIPVPKGQVYTVRLHFAEIFDNGPGQRVEDIAINGKPALTNFDIFAAAGGLNKAVVREFTGIVPDAHGNIAIHMTAAKSSPDQNAKISGIEILTPRPGVGPGRQTSPVS